MNQDRPGAAWRALGILHILAVIDVGQLVRCRWLPAVAAAVSLCVAVAQIRWAGLTMFLQWGLRSTARIDARTRGRPPAGLFRTVGYVPQGRGSLWPQYTVRQHVEIAAQKRGGRLRPGSAAARRAHAELILERALVPPGIWDRNPVASSDRGRAEAFSGGEVQRVALARALAGEPEALLLDEPDASLDAQIRSLIVDRVITGFLDQAPDRTAFLVTHNEAGWSGLQGRTTRRVFSADESGTHFTMKQAE